MRYAVNMPNFGSYGDARLLGELAHEAEESGWDGFFLWDHIGSGLDWPDKFADPWIALSVIATRTKRIKLGPMVTPLPRRRPWKVARETVTLDQLSGGRLILGVGIGMDFGREFSAFGEVVEDRVRGEMLDEGLEILVKLWSGEAFSFKGVHYQIENACFVSGPVQQPRIPIWVAGIWPNKKPFQRAARWDGVFPIADRRAMEPQEYREMAAYIGGLRKSQEAYEIIAADHTTGVDKGRDRARVEEFIEVGATWWHEGFDGAYSIEQVRKRIRQGPPRR